MYGISQAASVEDDAASSRIHSLPQTSILALPAMILAVNPGASMILWHPPAKPHVTVLEASFETTRSFEIPTSVVYDVAIVFV